MINSACPSEKDARRTPSTDEEVLQELALDYPLPKLLLEYRPGKTEIHLYRQTAAHGERETGRVHQLFAGRGRDRTAGFQ